MVQTGRRKKELFYAFSDFSERFPKSNGEFTSFITVGSDQSPLPLVGKPHEMMQPSSKKHTKSPAFLQGS